MKTLEQVYGKVKVRQETYYPTRVMQASSNEGNFQLIWKLKYGNWFLCSSPTKGWHHVFARRNQEVQTEASFRMWCRHSKATFYCEPDNHPPFLNLISPTTTPSIRTTTPTPRSDAGRSLNRVHAQARPL